MVYSIKTLKKSIKVKVYSITTFILSKSIPVLKKSLNFIDIKLLITFMTFLVGV